MNAHLEELKDLCLGRVQDGPPLSASSLEAPITVCVT